MYNGKFCCKMINKTNNNQYFLSLHSLKSSSKTEAEFMNEFNDKGQNFKINDRYILSLSPELVSVSKTLWKRIVFHQTCCFHEYENNDFCKIHYFYLVTYLIFIRLFLYKRSGHRKIIIHSHFFLHINK